jgi:hypothetical protein
VCDTVGADGIEVRYLNADDSKWLRDKGRRSIQKESLAPMCQQCFLEMTNAAVARRAAKVAQWVREDASSAEALAQGAREDALRRNGPKYREACEQYGDDLVEASRIAAEWGVGNGLFGSRGD